ncbi:hypothetical protein MVEN_00098100 [Mycena venus]|uniref:Uncharacterized protein n=1 Tax=Mycena venus TaxID=2733690 RepID=A0A8H6Z4F7_9AGAR|nr:hypothetical protein MVEN_00098100 [Mycena venus]
MKVRVAILPRPPRLLRVLLHQLIRPLVLLVLLLGVLLLRVPLRKPPTPMGMMPIPPIICARNRSLLLIVRIEVRLHVHVHIPHLFVLVILISIALLTPVRRVLLGVHVRPVRRCCRCVEPPQTNTPAAEAGDDTAPD